MDGQIHGVDGPEVGGDGPHRLRGDFEDAGEFLWLLLQPIGRRKLGFRRYLCKRPDPLDAIVGEAHDIFNPLPRRFQTEVQFLSDNFTQPRRPENPHPFAESASIDRAKLRDIDNAGAQEPRLAMPEANIPRHRG
jgi:hypothetical protein